MVVWFTLTNDQITLTQVTSKQMVVVFTLTDDITLTQVTNGVVHSR